MVGACLVFPADVAETEGPPSSMSSASPSFDARPGGGTGLTSSNKEPWVNCSHVCANGDIKRCGRGSWLYKPLATPFPETCCAESRFGESTTRRCSGESHRPGETNGVCGTEAVCNRFARSYPQVSYSGWVWTNTITCANGGRTYFFLYQTGMAKRYP